MRIIKHKLVWIDVQNPTKKDVEFIRKQHKFHPIILDELLHTSARSRVEPYNSYLYLTYHLPVYDDNAKSSRRAEVDFLITKDKVITVHYEDLEPLNNFWRRLNNDPHFKERTLSDTTGRIVYHLIEEILAFSQRQLRHIEENVTGLSKELFKKKEAQLLQRISYLKRDILDYSIISKPQGIILESLKEVGGKFWSSDIKVNLNIAAPEFTADFFQRFQNDALRLADDAVVQNIPFQIGNPLEQLCFFFLEKLFAQAGNVFFDMAELALGKSEDFFNQVVNYPAGRVAERPLFEVRVIIQSPPKIIQRLQVFVVDGDYFIFSNQKIHLSAAGAFGVFIVHRQVIGQKKIIIVRLHPGAGGSMQQLIQNNRMELMLVPDIFHVFLGRILDINPYQFMLNDSHLILLYHNW